MEAEKVTIRPLELQDKTQWQAMWKEYCDFYQETVAAEVTSALWLRFFHPGSVTQAVVALDSNGKLCGFAHYVLQENTWSLKPLCYLEDLFVQVDVRGRHIGHKLISHLVEMAQKKDWRKVFWHTQEGNTRARRLYERFGPSDGFVRYSVFP